jgi:hypothetical protein
VTLLTSCATGDLTHARCGQCLVQRRAIRALSALDFSDDAPVAAVEVRRDGLTLGFDASTLLGATRNELTM